MQMSFTPEQRDLIYAGKKTVHRIPADSRECRYQAGRVYRVRVTGEDKPMVVTVITPVVVQTLADLQPRDAIREGARHQRDYLTAFAEHYGDANPDRKVFVIEIAPGDLRDTPRFLASGGPAPICKAVDKRDGKPCNRAFAVGQERCKCGAKRPPDSADDYGYTTSHARAIDDAEALSDIDLKDYAWQAKNDADVLRDMPVREGIGAAIEGVATLREAMALMRQRNRERVRLMEVRLKGIERELEKVASELPSEARV
jgi:uncharacterized protein YqfB (UPF0267 family)